MLGGEWATCVCLVGSGVCGGERGTCVWLGAGHVCAWWVVGHACMLGGERGTCVCGGERGVPCSCPQRAPCLAPKLHSTAVQVVAGSTVLTSGVLPDGGPGFDPTLPRDLQLSVQGAAVHAVVAGQEVDGVVVPPGFLVGGLVGFGSGFHAAEFDAFALKGG